MTAQRDRRQPNTTRHFTPSIAATTRQRRGSSNRPPAKAIADAQYWLGRIYADGLGRPRDPVTAYGWFDRAAAQGHHDAAILRDRLAPLLAPDQIAEAQRRTDPAAAAGDQEARDLIAAVQRELNRLGYRSGPADGIAGNRTRRAIERFQRDAGLEVTGTATELLLDRLTVSTR